MRKHVFRVLLSALLCVACTQPEQPDPTPSVVEVTSVSLSQPTAEMLVGENVQLKASVQPSNATDKTLLWASSRQSVATVDSNGLVTAIAEGQSTITVSAGGKSATCTVTVTKATIQVSGISLDQTSLQLVEGGSAVLEATVTPADATDKTVTWSSSNTEVAKVSDQGVVTAVKEGSATVTATAGGHKAACTVTVTRADVPVSSISLDKTSLEMVEGETATLVATVTPADATDKTVAWSSSNPSVATVDGQGRVTAVKEGSTSIIASAGGKTAVCTVIVSRPAVPVSEVTLDRTSVSLEVGQTTQLVATVTPADASDKTVTWSSSDASVVTVNQSGKVEALKEGKATITARAGGKEATCLVTVVPHVVPVESITLDKTSLDMLKGEAAVLNATVLPANATDMTITWSSSDSSIAKVDQNGIVTALKGGNAVIMAKAGEKSAVCSVKVTTPVERVTLDKTSLTMEIGESATLVATVSPADASDKTVTWSSSDTSIAKVDQNGIVTAVKGGNTVITVRAGEKTAACSVTVKTPVESITLDKTTLSLAKGETATLIATVTPANASDKTVSWSTTDASVAQVDQNGIVTALKGGSAVIMAKAGEKSAVCSVKVTTPVERVTLDKTSLALVTGETATLVATVSPADATDKTVSWNSSDPSIVTVDANGKVTALKKGQATVTAKAGDKSAGCTVTVSNAPFGISPVSASVSGAGGTFQVTVTCSSSYHLNSKPEWVSETSVQGMVHTYTVSANPGSEARTGVLVFCDDEGTCLPCTVKQAAGGPFTLTPNSVEVEAIGGTFKLSVACSISYHINSKPDWITEIQEGADIQLHVFQVAENKSEEARSGVIVFCDAEGTCLPCTVKQKGKDPDSANGGNEDVTDGNPVKW